MHNFSLLHDDIMDGDTERRHRPTAWTVFGVGAAILAGDALLALANDLLLEDTAPGGPWAARCLSTAVQRLIAGQGEDLAFEERGDVTLAECIEMAGDKTAALMACACTIGAVHVGARARARDGPGRVRRARRPGVPAHRRPARHLGRARGDRQAGPRRPAGHARSRCPWWPR